MPQKRSAPKSSPNSAEDETTLEFPQFDSLPATAGLSNDEAFRLSIRHALLLLPAMFAKGKSFALPPKNPRRFSLR
jgi:hypothetical protein